MKRERDRERKVEGGRLWRWCGFRLKREVVSVVARNVFQLKEGESERVREKGKRNEKRKDGER